MRGLGTLVGVALLVCSSGAASGQERGVRYEAVQKRLEGWAADERVELIRYGKSAGGRELLAVRIARAGGTPAGKRPGVFVGANMAGTHTIGSQAALHLIETLLDAGNAQTQALLGRVTFYVAPALNPDAHGGQFAPPARWLREGNDSPLDRDRDGQVGEDGPDDLNGDQRITQMRFADPRGEYLPDGSDPRIMVRANALKGQRGRYRLVVEGADSDGDGQFNEDGAQGIFPDRSFAHGFPYPATEAGPWASAAPEARAVMDLLLARRNIAVAVVYGPANTLLELPKGFSGQAPWGDDGPVEIPKWLAGRLGLTPGKPTTIDKAWEAAKDMPYIRRNQFTKAQLAQMLQTKPAKAPAKLDVALLGELAKSYTERLEAAGQDPKRGGRRTHPGGFSPWLYFHYGVFTLELDVWGVPKAKKPDETKHDPPKPDDGAKPPASQPAEPPASQPAKPPASQPAEGPETAEKPDQSLQAQRDLLAFLDAHDPKAIVPWTTVTLPDGTTAEVGGVDPFARLLPPAAFVEGALKAHTATVLDLAQRLARVELLQAKAVELGGGLWRLDVVGGNTGFLPTHTRMAVRARSHLPVRLQITPGAGVTLVSGQRWRSAERLTGSGGTLQANWLLKGPAGSVVDVLLTTQTAGTAKRRVTLGGPK